MKWVTRANVKVDRVACPWLIKRFIDPEAEFLFVPEEKLLETARAENATPFDAPRLPEVRLNHRDRGCTFEAIMEDFKLVDPALHRLALIVRAADIKDEANVAPEGAGLRAIAEGFSLLRIPDEERLKWQFPLYDALHEYARHSTK
ncbi:MAG: chromate resistance protein [Acidobacteria bacterium]|nr:chromate resistance protein [Acidobacteriota bacterium]